MEGRQSKCNYWIHALLGCSHSLSCAFKSECENRRLGLLQRCVGLVLELSELSSCAFSQSENNCSRVVPMMMLLTSVSEKQRANISTDRSGMAPISAFWFDSVHTGSIGTGAMLVPGFGTQPYSVLSLANQSRDCETVSLWCSTFLAVITAAHKTQLVFA